MKRSKKKEVTKEKATAAIEQVFAHAVALDQSGRLRNTIYAVGKKIFIKNQDNTVLLRFFVPDGSFKNPISFKANDYEGDSFYEKKGKIIFETTDGGFIKEKSCSVPGQTPKEIDKMFSGYKILKKNRVTLGKDILRLINTSLSHVEISVEDDEFVLRQRDIYSGSVSKIEKSGGGLGISSDDLEGNFGPIGLRTADFEALFSFQESLNFYLDPKPGYICVTGTKWKMRAILGACQYDEMGTIKYIKE